MKLKHLLLAAVSAICGSAFAQNWTAPTTGSDPETGNKYYIMNVEACRFMTGKATTHSWSTTCGLSDEGLLVTLKTTDTGWTIQRSDDKYTFRSGADECHVDGSGKPNIYFDFTKTGTGYYTIANNSANPDYSNNNEYWGYQPKAAVPSHIYCNSTADAPDTYIEWAFVAEADYAGLLPRIKAYAAAADALAQYPELDLTEEKNVYDNESATAEQLEGIVSSIGSKLYSKKIADLAAQGNNADFTSLLVNPSFETGNMNGWTNNSADKMWTMMTRNNNGDPKVGTYWIEKYSVAGKLDISQVVKGLPMGQYRVSVLALDQASKTKLVAQCGETKVETPIVGGTSATYTADILLDNNSDLTIGLYCENHDGSKWVGLDDFKLTYVSSELPALPTTATGDMNTDVEQAQADAIAAYNANKSVATYKAAVAAIEAANASVAQYADVAAKVAALNEAGQTAFNASASGVKYAAKTLAATDDITADYSEAFKALGPGTDFTSFIVNPNFDGNINGWNDTFTGKLNHGFQNNATYGAINQFMECWAGQWSGAAAPYLLPNGKLYQSVYLPAGEYTLSADVIATQQQAGQAGYIASLEEVTGIYIYAQSDVLFKSDACNATGAEPKNYSFTFNTTGGPTELGLLIENTNCNWAVMDNVKLVYNGESTINLYQEALKEALENADDLSEVDANAALKQAYADAVSAAVTASENDSQSDEYYQTASSNMTAAKAAVDASVEVYKEIVKVNEKAAQLKGEAAAAAYADVLATYTNKTATAVAPFETAYNAAKEVATGGYQIEGIDNVWVGQTGNVAEWACPDMPNAPERYQGGAFTGDVMTKTLTGLKPGTYTVVLRGGASYTSGRGFDGGAGKNRAYLFANDALQSMEVYDRTSIAAGTVETATLTCGVKADGILKMGIQNKTIGANWFVINLVSVTYESSDLPTTDVELAVTDAQYATFMAPFDAELPAGVVAYTVDAVEKGILTLTEAQSIAANTPYVLYSENTVSETLKGVSEAEAATYTVGLLTGVYAPVEITEGYVLQKQEKVGFYKVSAENAKTIPANHAYLTVPADDPEANIRSFFFDAETAIATIEALTSGKAEIYNMNGVKINALQKGINIVNGKKILVK